VNVRKYKIIHIGKHVSTNFDRSLVAMVTSIIKKKLEEMLDQNILIHVIIVISLYRSIFHFSND